MSNSMVQGQENEVADQEMLNTATPYARARWLNSLYAFVCFALGKNYNNNFGTGRL